MEQEQRKEQKTTKPGATFPFGHSCDHELATAASLGLLGGLDANTGDPQVVRPGHIHPTPCHLVIYYFIILCMVTRVLRQAS